MWRFAEIRQLGDIVRHWGKHRPEKVALVDGAVKRTYADLDRRSNALANTLTKRGIRPGARIGFLGKNSTEFFELWFAASKIGCAIASFNWRCSEGELVEVVGDAKPAIVFVGQDLADVMDAVHARAKVPFDVVAFDYSGKDGDLLTRWMGDDASDAKLAVDDRSIALLTYTSGTTGQPKGAQFTQEAFDHSFLESSLEPALGWKDDDVILMSMPNFHLGGSWVTLAALYHGATIALIPLFDLTLVMEAMRRDRPTVLSLVPTAIHFLLAAPGASVEAFSSVRSVLYFGSPIGADLMRRASEAFRCELYQLYGATEMWFVTVLHPSEIAENPARAASCGKPLPLVQMKVVDADDEEAPHGTVGELLVRAPTQFAGYWQQPETTAKVLKDGWYRTGDLARRDRDGFFYIVDRVKDMVITGGENVYSVEVESTLAKHPAVGMVAVIGVPDETWGEKVTAFVVLAAGTTSTEGELQQHCRSLVAGYKVPKTIYFETALPMTPSGKVQKSVLRERVRAQ